MRVCSVPGCEKPWGAAGYCRMHYGRQHRYGRLDKIQQPTLEQRFWSKVNKTGTCWEWTGQRWRNGYGEFMIGFHPNVRRAAHRWIWEQTNGPIPEGLQVDHICRNRACVRLEHLRLLTPRDNLLCGIGPSATNARKTKCIRDHEYTAENTYVTARGARQCKTCNRMRARGEFKTHDAAAAVD